MKVATRAELGRDLAWRHPQWPSRRLESFVVSFPKSGRTWLRVMLGAVEAQLRGVDVAEGVRDWIEQDTPSLGGKPVLFTHALSDDPREPPAAIECFLAYIGDRRRLFVVRDPRDIVVSYYFQHAKRQRTPKWQRDDISRFVHDPGFGIDRVLSLFWACGDSLHRHDGPSMLVSYEELHRATESALRSIVEFFDVEPSDAELEVAVAHASFENMRRMEVERSFDDHMQRLSTHDVSDPESLKTRRGVVGGFRDYLSAPDLAYIERRIAECMPEPLGYLEPGVPPPNQIVGQR